MLVELELLQGAQFDVEVELVQLKGELDHWQDPKLVQLEEVFLLEEVRLLGSPPLVL